MGIYERASVLAHDVAVNVALARRLGLGGWNPGFGAETDRIVAELNGRRAAAFREALELANPIPTRPHRSHAPRGSSASSGTTCAASAPGCPVLQSRLEHAVRTDGRSQPLLPIVWPPASLSGSAALGCYGSHGDEYAGADVRATRDVADRGRRRYVRRRDRGGRNAGDGKPSTDVSGGTPAERA